MFIRPGLTGEGNAYTLSIEEYTHMPANKKKLNLTINPDLLEQARQVAEADGSSISSLVEDFLGRLVADHMSGEADWLTGFHRKYLGKNHKEPSAAEIKRIRQQRLGKYS